MATDHRGAKEHFSQCGPKLKKENKEQTTIKSTSGRGVNTAYGFEQIPSTGNSIYKWHLKIDNRGNGVLVIGISSCQETQDVDLETAFYKNTDSPNYGYNLFSGYKVSCGEFAAYGETAKTGDVVTTIVDCGKGTISHQVNGIAQGIAHHIQQNAVLKYRYCVSMQDIGDTVTITHFEANHPQIDEKSSQIRPLVEPNLMMQNKQKIMDLETENRELKATINTMKQRVKRLENETKEYELEINSLKKEVEELRVKSIDLDGFKQWHEEDVLIWIFSIQNGLFKKYEKELTAAIIKGEIKGIDLLKIKSKHISEFGVTKFADRAALEESIDRLRAINEKRVSHDNIPPAYADEGPNVLDTARFQ
eukprot:233251_1